MFQRIFVPLDGSARAERALSAAARVAHATGSSITLLRVATVPIDFAWVALEAPVPLKKVLDMDLEKAQEYLTQVAASPLLKGIETHTEVLPGMPAPTILSATQAGHADLIVMCSHGETGIKRWMVGSVAQKVSRVSPIPVLVLHERGSVPETLHPEGTRPINILVALDGSELAEQVLAPAAELSAALSAPAPGKLHLTHVLSLFNAGRDSQRESIVELRKYLLDDAQAYLDRVVQRFQEGDLAHLSVEVTSSIALEKDVAGTLISMAENGEHMQEATTFPACDMIALATHGRGGIERWAMGSVTERVLGATRLPLLIVHPSQAKTGEQQGSKHIEVKATMSDPPSWVALF